MSFILGPLIGFLIPNAFLWKDDEVIKRDFESYLKWILAIECGVVVLFTLPAYFLFKDKPEKFVSRIAKTRRCGFKSTCKYIFQKTPFYLLFIAFGTSSAILFQLISMIGPLMEIYNNEVSLNYLIKILNYF